MDRRIERPKWRRRLPLIAGAAAVVALIVGAIVFAPRAGSLSVEAETLQIAEAQQAPFEDFLPSRAQAEPAQTVFVDVVVGGRVERLMVEDGDLVAAGQVIAVLSNPQLQLDVSQREADIAGRLSGITDQRLAIERNRLEREREAGEAAYNLLRADRELQIRSQLHAREIVSDADLQRAQAEADFYRQRTQALAEGERVQGAGSRTQAAEVAQTAGLLRETLGAVRAGLDALEVRAPVAGRLTAFELQPGQALDPGDRVGQVGSEGDYKLVADVDEFYVGWVTPGQTATARQGDRVYRLRVTRVLPQISEGRFRAELAFQGDRPPELRRGQTFDIRITLGATATALTLPNAAFLADSGGNWAYVVDPGGETATRRAITIGRRNPERVEVTSGLEPGDRVVTSSYAAFSDRDRLILR